MADFDWKSVYNESNWIVNHSSAQGLSDRFLSQCKQYAESTQFPNLEIFEGDFKSGGWLSSESTFMVGLKFRTTNFKKLAVYFRAQQFGNLVYYSVLNTVERGFWEDIGGKDLEEIIAEIRSKCDNLADWEEFSALRVLGNLIFEHALRTVDPDYEERKRLEK